MNQVQLLCRQLKPILGRRVGQLWAVYLAESDPKARAEIEQTLELLAAKHLGRTYEPDRAPFPPPPRELAGSGQLNLGQVTYGNQALYPFALHTDRLKEHMIVVGRSGSGKTNATLVLMRELMQQGVHVLAFDWKRSYRDLAEHHPDLRIHTIGRDVSPLPFNPLIPPPGCEPNIWIKLVVDIVAGAYLGGEGVISLLIGGLTHLYNEHGVYDGTVQNWPTIQDLLGWLRSTKLKGRPALWRDSAERILQGLLYGELGRSLHTQHNIVINDLLNHNVVLEMDGLSGSSDRKMFSEALTMYLYRMRLVQGPQPRLTNVMILEEAHHLLPARQPGSSESVLETSIRMIRQYGIGYVIVDQSASLMSRVAFSNSYATIALNQKLKSDVQTIAGAMNLTDEQKEALSTLPVGTAVVRLADKHPEPFLIRVPLCPVREGSVSDADVRQRMAGYFTDSSPAEPIWPAPPAIPLISPADKNPSNHLEQPHPPSPQNPIQPTRSETTMNPSEPQTQPRTSTLNRESIRFLADVAARPLSTTVSRYQRLQLSRRRGNAIRKDLLTAGLIDPVAIATRSGQVILYELSDTGRTLCESSGIDTGPRSTDGLEHRYWIARVADLFEKQGYDTTREFRLDSGGAVDVVAERTNERIAVEVETGRSDMAANLRKLADAEFTRIITLATNAQAADDLQKLLANPDLSRPQNVETWTWLDV